MEKMKITDTVAFGRAVKEKRRKLGYTQGFLADFSGLSVSFISDLENGKHTCELGKALYVANILGMDCVLDDRK